MAGFGFRASGVRLQSPHSKPFCKFLFPAGYILNRLTFPIFCQKWQAIDPHSFLFHLSTSWQPPTQLSPPSPHPQLLQSLLSFLIFVQFISLLLAINIHLSPGVLKVGPTELWIESKRSVNLDGGKNYTLLWMLKPGLENFEHYFTSVWDECNCAIVWAFFGIAFLWDRKSVV